MKRLVVIIVVVMSSLVGATKTSAQVGVGVSVTVAPPELPVYVQPACPGDGYMWTPGYWAWGPDGYYWVPGVWVLAPQVGFLWTPGYWGFVNGGYFWHAGYWGPHVGFYGGVNYGFGYGGTGFYGGRWSGGRFAYNTAVWHVGGSIHNTYVDRTVIVNNTNRSSFNGRGGVVAQPNAAEQAAARENHIQATAAQRNHAYSASVTKGQRASANGGHPSAMARSTVGGPRYNSAGHPISAPRANHASAHPAPVSHVAPRPAPQVQHAAPSRSIAQPRPAIQRAPAPRPAGGRPAGRPMGGGGGHERR